MKMTIKKLILFFFFIISINASNISIEAIIDKKEVSKNQEINLKIKISWQGKLGDYEIQDFAAPSLTNLEIKGSSSSNKIEDKGNFQIAIKEYKFILQPKDLGMAYIEPFTIYYLEKSSCEKFSLKINRMEIKILDEFIQKKLNFIYIIFIFLGIIVIILFINLKIINLKKKKNLIEQEEKIISLEEKLLENLEKLNNIRITGEIKQYYSSISSLVKEYIFSKFNINKELPTSELINILSQYNLKQEMLHKIKIILEKCDMVKFACYQPQSEELNEIYLTTKELFTIK